MGDNIFNQKKAFNFYRSYYETSLLLQKEDKAEFLEAILHYQFTGELIEPNSPMALLAFRGQIHSLRKQVIGYEMGKNTYPNGNPTKGKDKGEHKGSHKEVQDKVQVQEKVQVQVQEKEVNNITSISKEISETKKNELFKENNLVKTEEEKEKKVAQKKEKELKPDLDTFIDYARLVYQNELKIDFSPFIFAVTSKFNDWNDSGWNDGNGKPILSWKNKLRNSIPYFKPINNNSHGNTKTPTNQFNSNQSQTRTGRQILAERLINATKANGESGSTIIDVEAL